MRIAMISEHASPLGYGGQHTHVADLSAALAEIGHEVRVYTRRDDPSVADTVATSSSPSSGRARARNTGALMLTVTRKAGSLRSASVRCRSCRG